MEWLDPLVFARLQFAFTASFHIIFPALTIGLASYLAVLEALWLITKREVFLTLVSLLAAFQAGASRQFALRSDQLIVLSQTHWCR